MSEQSWVSFRVGDGSRYHHDADYYIKPIREEIRWETDTVIAYFSVPPGTLVGREYNRADTEITWTRDLITEALT